MPKNSFLQALFKGPKFSVAPIEENNRGSVKIGTVVPVFANIVNPREGVELNMAHLVRFLPAKAPVMEGYKVTFDAFAVPYSCLGYAERKERDLDDFFNLKENEGYIENPFCYPMSKFNQIMAVGSPNLDDDRVPVPAASHVFAKHSLGDYLNFPSLKAVKDHVRKWLSVNPFLYGSNLNALFDTAESEDVDSVGYSIASFVALAYLNRVNLISGSDYFYVEVDLSGRSHGTARFFTAVPFSVSENPVIPFADGYIDATEASIDVFYNFADVGHAALGLTGFHSLLGYVLDNYPAVASYYGYVYKADNTSMASAVTNMANHIAYLMDEENPISLDYLQVLYDNYGIDAQTIYDEYFEYIMGKFLYKSDIVNKNDSLLYDFQEVTDDLAKTFLPSLADDEPVDLSYFAAYWKIISDWYINTNIDGDPDDFFLSHCRLLTDSDGPSGVPARYVDVQPFVRRWANDVFTSCVPESKVQNVRIPSDGTIPDLRDANAFQRLKDILRNTGSRLRDVDYGLRGVLPSAVRSEMAEPIATLSTWVGFQSVLQTSQTTADSPQAAYSGIGTDSQGHRKFFKYINNDEPTPVIVMVVMSVTQRASYMQGFDRKFFRKSIYDFAIPQLAMVGEQELTNKEVYFDKDYESGIFGFNRRYYDWFTSQSQVHGELRDSLDYWHGARFFDEQPYLNSEFIGINSDVDHLQRIFANTSESAAPILYNLSFDGYFTRALPRYIQYEL